MRFRYGVAIAALGLAFSGCSRSPAEGSSRSASLFHHEVEGERAPWTHERFDADDSRFTFAVIADLTGDERERVFEIAVAQLNLLRPELIVSVGDLIEGDSGEPGELAAEWDWFDERVRRARAPFFYAGGNHDLTGERLRSVWEERYGPRYYHFRYKDVLFLILDTEDHSPERMEAIQRARNEAVELFKAEGMDAFQESEYARMPERSAGTVGPGQAAYFQTVIAENSDVRWTFVLVHKPAWEREGEIYFAAIESALADRPYTVFNGHVQAYEYAERHGRDYIQVATTGGRQFPELGRSADHVTLVTVSGDGVDIANLLLEGILDKTGKVPLGGDDVCFEEIECGAAASKE